MPIARFQMPDGRIARFEVPEGTTTEQAQGMISSFLQEQSQTASPADEMGRGEALLVSAGRGTDQVVKGIQQLYYKATGNKQAEQDLAARQAEETALYKPLQEKFQVVTAIGESAPAAAIPVGGGATLFSTIGRAAVAGSIPGLVSYGSGGERLARGTAGAAGGAVGGAAGYGLSRLLKPAGVGTVGASDEALSAANRIGYKPSAGDVSQNPALKNFENYLARSPGSSGRMQSFNEANQAALNRAAAKSIGENADNLSEGVFRAAENRIGGEFNRLSSVTSADLSKPKFLNALVQIDSSNAARGPYANASITKEVEKALDMAAQGKITGVAYKEIRTEISSQAEKAFKAGDSTLGKALKTIREGLDDAAKSGLSKEDRAAWDMARQQWRAFKVLTKSNISEAGNVSAARVASELRRGGPSFRTGDITGELADVARVGEAFKGVTNPNSGNLVQQMIYGNPLTGIPMYLGNKSMGAAYMSGPVQAYMGRGLVDIGPGGVRELSRAAGLLGIPASKEWLGVE